MENNVKFGFLNFGPTEDDVTKGKTTSKAATTVPVLHRRKAFALVGEDCDIPTLANDLGLRWVDRIPDVMISLVSGYEQFHNWKRDDFRAAFQAGIVKLIGSLDVLIIDDALNYGLTRLTSNAVQQEESFRTYATAALQSGPRKPPINYIGVSPLAGLACKDSFQRLGRNLSDNEVEIMPRVNPHSSAFEFDLNPYHSSYLIADRSYADTGFLRIDLEKQIQNEIASRETNRAEGGSESAHMPLIVFFFQGEFDEIDRIATYVRLRTPVIIMNGAGGMADVLAAALKMSGGGMDEFALNEAVMGNLMKNFPRSTQEARSQAAEKIMEVIQNGPGLLFPIDCSRLDTFSNLDLPVLQAILSASAAQNPTVDQFNRNMRLCITCNKPDVAKNMLMGRPPWIHLQPKAPFAAFTASLLFPGRESFVDMFLQQKIPLRHYLSHIDLLTLFRKAVGKELFTSLVWDDILGHNQSDPIREDFVLHELNPLVEQLTRIKNFFDFYEMSRIALTRDENVEDPALADENALNALVVYAVLLNRAKLVKVLLKFSVDPVPLIIFVETMYRGIYRQTNNMELRMGLKRQADEFGEMATSILDIGIRESPERAKQFFSRALPRYNNKTVLEMAYDARNKKFISHPLVQNWLDGFSLNFIRVRGGMHELKMVLSAWLVFPMYIWLSFPRHTAKVTASKELDYVYEPKNEDEADDMLRNLERKNHKNSLDVQYKEVHPSPFTMIASVWNAPAIKFWTWSTIYMLFLIILGVDMMNPACRYIGVDIAVFVCTALMWLELVTRTAYDLLWKRRVNLWMRGMDFVFQTVWNVIFFLYRIAPYRYDHPFAGRVIVAFGCMYYFYSVWQLFYGYHRQIGPLVRVVNLMFKHDMPKWMAMMLPFFVSTAVVWQAVITPDYPFTGDDWRRAFYRATFTVFGAFYNELEYNEGCEKSKLINWKNFTQPASAYPADRCWVGDYTDHTCNTVSFWGYVFVIHYYFLLKLGMMIVLVVFYIFRQTIEMPKADIIWRYSRFQTIMDYHYRPPQPFPFNILGNLYYCILYFTSKGKAQLQSDSEMADIKLDTFVYWKSKAAEFFAKQDQQDAARGLPMKQSQLLGTVKGDVQSIISRFSKLDHKLHDVDEQARAAGQRLQMTASDMMRKASTMSSDIHAAACPVPHVRSRESPYPGTDKRRAVVPDNKVDWSAAFEAYDPRTYSKPLELFSADEQEFVDPENDGRESRDMRSSASVKSFEWNSIEYRDEQAINRKSWLVDPDTSHPLAYRVDRTGLPMNPQGRTGVRGRGNLCRYGPNQTVMFAITNFANGRLRYIMQKVGQGSTLPTVPVCHYESEFAVATAFFDSLFSSDDSDVDPSLVRNLDEFKKVISELVRMYLDKNESNREKTFPPTRVTERYRGYFDSPLNTDNAWMEMVVIRIEMPFLELASESVYRWKIASGPESTLPDFDATVLRNITA